MNGASIDDKIQALKDNRHELGPFMALSRSVCHITDRSWRPAYAASRCTPPANPLQRRFKAAPGVIDVTGRGGKTKTYDVTVDLNKLISVPDPVDPAIKMEGGVAFS